jgi:hypothetical protein
MLPVDQVGELLFGRAMRLVLASWVLARLDPLFYQSEAALGTGFSQSNVRDELDRLIQVGMVQEIPRHRGDRRRYYLRTESPLWDAVRIVVAQTTELRLYDR